MYGWTGKILRVDLSRGKTSIEELDPKVARTYFGGRGLGARYLLDEVDPGIEPLSEGNKLMFAAGPATGAPIVSGNRYNVVTKSPLTGTIAGPSSAGFWAPELKFAGYDMVIVEGKAKNPVYVWIEDDKVEIRPASHLWGKSTNETQKEIRNETRPETKVASIGPAGERLVRFACVINDEGRAAGRGGVGAVAGSKNLKAIAVRGTKKVPIADTVELKRIVTRILGKMPKPSGLSLGGTPYVFASVQEIGILPTRNFQTGVFEGWEKISGQAVNKEVVYKHSACYRCPIGCGRLSRVTKAPFEGEGAGPEYEGLYALGSNCGVDDLSAVVKAFFLCNELGMDVMSCGATIACAMELSQKGFLPEKDVGMKLNFGDGRTLVEMVRKTGMREGFGDLIAEGSYRLAERYGHPELSMSVKKQELAGYDPRGVQGLGLGYAVSTRGACHVRGEINNAEIWGAPVKLDRLATKGKASYLITIQDEIAASDSMGICQFCGGYKIGVDAVIEEMELVSGVDLWAEGFYQMGERIWNMEKIFNMMAGFTAADDTLPRRFLEEPMPEGPTKGHVCRLWEMLPEYYHLRGWDKEGRPTRDKLKELGLLEFARKI
ncbi:MAG: aldehyde ferredoxin oxidoreductase family protein [Chloroflexi bacterium]|nr:aldehyde ferredoxin oxidoreductase family protein [Chloroflexota bacterium]